MRALLLILQYGSLELFNSNQSEQTSHNCSASYRKIYGYEEINSDSEDELEDSDHELDCGANNKDSDASPTGFMLADVGHLTMAISHTRCEQCKDDKLSLTEGETQRAGLMTSFYIQCHNCKHMIHLPSSWFSSFEVWERSRV